MTTERINKILEAIFSVLGVVGVLCISNELVIGWVICIVSSTIAVIWAIRTRNFYFMFMQAVFVIANICGIYNFIITPYLA